MPDWWLDELARAGAEHLDELYVASYERKAGYDPEPDLAVLERFGLDSRSAVLDVGAGVGVFAAAAAARCGSVIALELSPAMVAALRWRVDSLGLANPTISATGVLSYEHTAEPVDFVFSRNVLHQLPDFWKGIVLTKIAAVLRPQGILRLHDLVFDFEPAEATTAIPAWLEGAVDDPRDGWTADELAEHVRLEHSTYSWLFEPMIERCGFEILDSEYRRGAYGAYTCRRR